MFAAAVPRKLRFTTCAEKSWGLRASCGQLPGRMEELSGGGGGQEQEAAARWMGLIGGEASGMWKGRERRRRWMGGRVSHQAMCRPTFTSHHAENNERRRVCVLPVVASDSGFGKCRPCDGRLTTALVLLGRGRAPWRVTTMPDTLPPPSKERFRQNPNDADALGVPKIAASQLTGKERRLTHELLPSTAPRYLAAAALRAVMRQAFREGARAVVMTGLLGSCWRPMRRWSLGRDHASRSRRRAPHKGSAEGSSR